MEVVALLAVVFAILPYLLVVRLLWHAGSYFAQRKLGSNHYLEIRHLPDEEE